MGRPPLILLPGLGATPEVFAAQRRAVPELVTPPWLPPRAGESLEAYARRFAEAVDPGAACLVGGLSFGGIVAGAMCRHLQARRLVLISSLLHPGEMPRRLRVSLPLLRRMPEAGWTALQAVLGLLEPPARRLLPSPVHALLLEGRRADPGVVRWSLGALADWSEAPEPSCPVSRIHGAWDPVFPARCAPGARILPRSTHVLPLFRPAEVSAFLETVLDARAG